MRWKLGTVETTERMEIPEMRQGAAESFCQQLGRTSLVLGRALHRSGAETYRIEDSVAYFLLASGMEDVEIFAVANYLAVHFRNQESSYSFAARLRVRSSNLDQLDHINDLCRRYCAEPFELRRFDMELKQITESRGYPLWLCSLATGVASAAFATLLGTPPLHALWGIPIGVLMYLMLDLLKRYHSHPIFLSFVGSALISTCAVLLNRLGLITTSEMGQLSIGALMNLVPGLTLTNAIRDLIASDYLSGLSNLAEAFLTSTCLALGTGSVLGLASLIG